MSEQIKRVGRLIWMSALLYRELAVSALSLLPSRRPSRATEAR